MLWRHFRVRMHDPNRKYSRIQLFSFNTYYINESNRYNVYTHFECVKWETFCIDCFICQSRGLEIHEYWMRFPELKIAFLLYFQYSVLLFLLLIAQIVVGVLVFTNKHEVQRFVERIVNQLWRDRQNNQRFWDVVQQLVSWTVLILPTHVSINLDRAMYQTKIL